jgi:hypothetical protein
MAMARMRSTARLVGLLLATSGGSTAAGAQNVYYGTLHAHTSYSDGSGRPSQAFAAAEAAGMHFMAITEHNHRDAERGAKDRTDGKLIALDHRLYRGRATSLVEAAGRATRAGRFVALYGQEYSTIGAGNHVNVFDAPSVIDIPSGEFDQLLGWIRANPDSSGLPSLLQFNHANDGEGEPDDYGRDDFPNGEWVARMDPFVGLFEVLNAPALKRGEGFPSERRESEYLTHLNFGFHIAPSVGHDNHYENWGRSTEARLAVIAPELTKPALMDALRRRRTYATEDRNLRVIFRIGAALGGDIVAPPAGGGDLPVTVEISDPDEPQARYRIDVFMDSPGGERALKPVETYLEEGDTAGPLRLDGIRLPAQNAYVLLRITQAPAGEETRSDRAWTAPIWFERPVVAAFAAVAAPAPPGLRILSLLPNPVGDDASAEAVTIRNDGPAAIPLTGWRVRDLAENEWALDVVGILQPGEQRTLLRAGQPMSLNNGGDTVHLVAPQGDLVQTVTYERIAEGQVVTPR